MAIDIWEERFNSDYTHSSTDVRNEWEHDYARLIHSSAFRRLQSKTQVLGLGESDFYRTRLTHSMEVAQIGTGILRWLKQRHKDETEIHDALPRSSLMNTICLAHDIGHPPFGHGGEIALNICMRKFGGFEGNGQTLRIISKLDKYTKENGMNPTRRLLLGILKYPVAYSKAVNEIAYGPLPEQKWLCKSKEQHPPKCYLDDESELVNWILNPLTELEKSAFTETEQQFDDDGKPKHNKSKFKGLDTSIMELADDISYSLHDLEDAIALGMVTRNDWDEHFQIREQIELFSICGLDVEKIGDGLFSSESYLRKEEIGSLVHTFITGTVVAQSAIPGATTPLVKWNAIMEKNKQSLIKSIAKFVKKKVIQSPNVQQLEFKGQKLVVELFTTLQSDPLRLLAMDAKNRFEKAETDPKRMRVICDFIAGMTDEYATRFYEKLFNPHKGSIFDRL